MLSGTRKQSRCIRLGWQLLRISSRSQVVATAIVIRSPPEQTMCSFYRFLRCVVSYFAEWKGEGQERDGGMNLVKDLLYNVFYPFQINCLRRVVRADKLCCPLREATHISLSLYIYIYTYTHTYICVYIYIYICLASIKVDTELCRGIP